MHKMGLSGFAYNIRAIVENYSKGDVFQKCAMVDTASLPGCPLAQAAGLMQNVWAGADAREGDLFCLISAEQRKWASISGRCGRRKA
jgi:hypothetical protein